jgi:GxxExxY protein
MSLVRVQSTLPDDLEALVTNTIGCCVAVHRAFGPGLSESAYAGACCIELEMRSIPFEREKTVPVFYKARFICQQRIDILVAERLVVEIKSVERIHPAHVAQTVSYLRLLHVRVGLVVNFNVPVLKQGLRRVVL